MAEKTFALAERLNHTIIDALGRTSRSEMVPSREGAYVRHADYTALHDRFMDLAEKAQALCEACKDEVESVFSGEIGEELAELRRALAAIEDKPLTASQKMIALLMALASTLEADHHRRNTADLARRNLLERAQAMTQTDPLQAPAQLRDLLVELEIDLDAQIDADSKAYWFRTAFHPNHPQQTPRQKFEFFAGRDKHMLLTRTRDAIAGLSTV